MIGLKGLTHDPTKQDKQSVDVGWRIRNNLEPYYRKLKNRIKKK